MRILVTGAAGYVGRHVTAAALAAGHEVTGTLRDRARAPALRVDLAARPGGGDVDRLDLVALDLLDDAGWDAAMAGVDAVLHTASPVPVAAPTDDEAVIRPAVEGTRRVLAAAARAGVRRAVVTSSIAAVLGAAGKGPGDTYGADDWTDTGRADLRAYARAKTLAERAARETAAARGIALASVLPGFVFGAPLGGPVTSSLTLIARLMDGAIPALPRLAFPSVAVGAVAEAHLRALAAPEGARILASGETLWLPEMAAIVRAAVPGARVPRLVAPDWLVRLAARVSPDLRAFAGGVGEARYTDPASCTALLGRPLADPRAAVAETARTLAARALAARR